MPNRITRLTLALLTLVVAADARAQIIGAPRRPDPANWASGGVGLWQAQTIDDYATESAWNFGTVTQWRAAFEHTLRNGGTVGLAGAISRPSLSYEGEVGGCQSCDARANVWQVLALFRIGGGSGFHQVIELHAGATAFSNFRAADDDRRLAPTGTVIDPTFSIGYGFAYGFGRGSQLVLVQDLGAILHRRQNAPSGANTLRQYQLTRIGLRVAIDG
jgi:hypothetical protein